MKRFVAILLAVAILVVLPFSVASARGGWGGGGGFGRGGMGGFGGRGSRRDEAKLRDRTKAEDADALLRDAGSDRRGN